MVFLGNWNLPLILSLKKEFKISKKKLLTNYMYLLYSKRFYLAEISKKKLF